MTTTNNEVKVLDRGYVRLIETWGSDERIIESARMSTAKGFLGWGPSCSKCGIRMVPVHGGGFSPADYEKGQQNGCEHDAEKPGDEKLLKFLWDNAHHTPFEMAGFTIEVKAPIFVFREWMRHRVPFGYNEMSARYVPLPDESYIPSVARLMAGNTATTNKQAQGTGRIVTEDDAALWLARLEVVYALAQSVYEDGIALGIPKEVARLPVPVARYSVMRATSNLRGWLGFLKLRCDPAAQWEIREYANAVAGTVREVFPRVHDVAAASLGLP